MARHASFTKPRYIRRDPPMTPARAALAVLACCLAGAAAASSELARDLQLVEAARRGDLAAASRLLQQGASANAIESRFIPLENGNGAAQRGVALRLDETALAAAARSGSLEIARLLITAGADANRSGARRDTPLSIAVARADLALADLLLRAGARTDARDPAGSLPLSRAVVQEDAALVRRLLEAGADPDGRERDGTTALAEAVRLGRIDLARLILDAGARVDLADREGKGPLYRAIVLRRTPIALLLLERGADPRRRVGGEDMAELARWAGEREVLERLGRTESR
jgi:ankyrin repeat protein